jgi:nucleotide-binding universal stress UspA family protein
MSELKDLLLALNTYPDPTPEPVIDWAVNFAHICGSKISALVSVLDRKKLARAYSHGSWLLDVPALIDSAISTSAQNGSRLMERFENEARARGVFQDQRYERSEFFLAAERVVPSAKTRDLVITPVPDYFGLDELNIEDLIFETGRPTILVPAYDGAPHLPVSLDRVVVAWDFSRAASRTLADAIPLLQKAKKVAVVTFRGEKDIPEHLSLKEVDRHLQMHGVKAEMEDASIDERIIGDAICEYVSQHRADMLVMGAFGHSRLREFVLGGASRAIITKPPLPVFMSH